MRFYFDYISHNAYLAWTQIHALADRHGRRVEAVPVLFAGLLNTHGQKGPAEVPPKAWWMAKNVLRKTVQLGVPLNPPRTHPFNPLLALRVTSVAMHSDIQRRLIDALFRAVWVDAQDVTDADTVARVASAAGLDGPATIAAAQQADVKDRLRAQTDAAIDAGVFGVPTVIVDSELFWGFDDFAYLELFLAGADPLPASLDAWSQVRPSASRTRR